MATQHKFKSNEKPRKRRGWWWKGLLGVLLLLLIGLTIAIRNINSIVHTRINQALTRYLSEGGSLDAFNIQLIAGRIKLSGLTINSPRGYGTAPLLALDSLALDINPLSLLEDEIVVEQITLKGGSLILVRDNQGQLSPVRLLPSAGQESGPESTIDEEEKPPSIPAVRVNAIRVENLAVRLIDRMVDDQWSANLTLDLAVDDLQPGDLLKQDIRMGAVDLALSKIKVEQPAGFGQAPMLAADRIELATPGFDPGASRLSVSKVLLNHVVVSVERNASGQTNWHRLLDAWKPAASTAAQSSAGKQTTAAAGGMPVLVFEDIELTSIALQLLDHIEGQPWRAGFDGLDAKVTGLEVGKLKENAISLDSFNLGLKGVAVDHPPGFDDDRLFSAARLAVTTGGLDLASPELVINLVRVQGLTASITVKDDGISNIQKLYAAQRRGQRATSAKETRTQAETDTPAHVRVLPKVRVEQVQLEDGDLHYKDKAIVEEGLFFPLHNIRLAANQLRLFDDKPSADPASVSLSFELEQSGKLPDAQYGAVASMGPAGSGVPPMNAQIRWTGVKLETLGSLVPPATRSAFGADGFDAGFALSVNKKAISLYGILLSDADVQYDAIHVQGPLNKPAVETGPVLAGVFNRVSGGLLNLGKSGLHTGAGIVEGGVDVAGEVGSGALKIGKNIGKNLFKIGSGIAKLDHRQVGSGLVGSTKGTISLTADSAKGTGSAAGGGLTSSFSSLTGADALQAWDEGIATRHRAAMQQAREALAKMPYPPVTE